MQEDGTIVITHADLLVNATDVDNDTLTISGVGYSGNQGTLTQNQDGTSYTFTPAPNFNGDLQLSFTVNDGTVNTTANIYLKVESVNDGPKAENDTANVLENASVNIDVLANDTDVDAGDALTIKSVDSAVMKAGTVRIIAVSI
jgi:hypothetical protein